MLSYNWNHQATIKRINTALKARKYVVWIDIEKMKGSTVEMMADAVEDCDVMCYGISQAYKESTNCRMEAQYAFQQQKDMVPLLVEQDYHASGWLGMMLGMRLYCKCRPFSFPLCISHSVRYLTCVGSCIVEDKFYGTVVASEVAFEAKVDELCRELGERGRAK